MNNPPTPSRRSLAFGLDRIGLVAFGRPRLVVLFAVIVSAVTVYGFFHISIDRDLRDLFRGETEIYQTYAEAVADFVDPENQIMVIVEGAIGVPENFEILRDLQLELQLIAEVGSVFSPFSLRSSPDENGSTRPIVADPSAGLDAELIDIIRAHPILGEAVLSADGSVLLFTITHAVAKAALEEHDTLIAEVSDVVQQMLGGTGLESTVAGFAAMRTEIVRLLERDQIVLNGSGIIIGFFLSLLLFRSFTAALITAVPAAFAGITILGWTGALGIPVTILSTVVPALVMVLGYADGMHLTAAWRRYREDGHSIVDAERLALIEVGPACMLTALTTSVAFLSMTLSDVGIVRDFGWLGAVGAVLATTMVLIGHGLGARLLGRFWKLRGSGGNLINWLSGPSGALADWVTARARTIAIISVPVVVGMGVAFFSVPPEHSLSETLPPASPMVAALNIVDEELGGAFPIQIIVPLADAPVVSEEGLDRIRAVHEAVAGFGASRPLSLWSLAEWAGVEPGDDIARMLDGLPDTMRQLFVGELGGLVSVSITELPTAETALLVDQIEAAAVAAVPGSIITGAVVVGAREATRTIGNLNRSLGLAVVAALILLAVAIRSVGAGLVAAIPNLLPIVAVGTILNVIGSGMQLTSVVSLTIAFGIAIDDTIHYLNVLFRTPGRDIRSRLVATSRQVGPVLIGTTFILVGGMLMTQTSGLATIALFGLLAIGALIVALFGDLVFLPAIIAGPARRLFDRKQ